MKDLVRESDRGALVRIAVWQRDEDLPHTARKWRCSRSVEPKHRNGAGAAGGAGRTLRGTVKAYHKLLHRVVHQGDLVIRHETAAPLAPLHLAPARATVAPPPATLLGPGGGVDRGTHSFITSVSIRRFGLVCAAGSAAPSAARSDLSCRKWKWVESRDESIWRQFGTHRVGCKDDEQRHCRALQRGENTHTEQRPDLVTRT